MTELQGHIIIRIILFVFYTLQGGLLIWIASHKDNTAVVITLGVTIVIAFLGLRYLSSLWVSPSLIALIAYGLWGIYLGTVLPVLFIVAYIIFWVVIWYAVEVYKHIE